METIKNQILNQISSSEAKDYIRKHIFGDLNLKKDLYSNNTSFYHVGNSSSIFSSYLPNFTQPQQKLSIKNLLNRIQKLIVMNGLYKTVQEIKELKNKTLKLQNQNQEIELKLNEERNKLNQEKINKSRRRQSQNAQSSRKYSKSIHKTFQTFQQSRASNILSFKEQIKEARQKLEHEKARQSMIQLVKVSSQQKIKLLQNTRKQYSTLIDHIDRLERVIKNTEQAHPEESWLRFEVDELQREVNQKRMLLQEDSRLQTQIEKLQRKVYFLEQKKLLTLYATKQSQNQQNSNPFRQKIFEDEQRIQQLEEFIRQENSEKQLLVNDIMEFNASFQNQKAKHEKFLKKIKDNFYSCPEIIDFLIKQKQNPLSNVDFIFKELQIQL